MMDYTLVVQCSPYLAEGQWAILVKVFKLLDHKKFLEIFVKHHMEFCSKHFTVYVWKYVWESIILLQPQHLPLQIHKKIPWKWDPAGVWYVERQRSDPVVKQKIQTHKLKNVITFILFHFHVLMLVLCFMWWSVSD